MSKDDFYKGVKLQALTDKVEYIKALPKKKKLNKNLSEMIGEVAYEKQIPKVGGCGMEMERPVGGKATKTVKKVETTASETTTKKPNK